MSGRKEDASMRALVHRGIEVARIEWAFLRPTVLLANGVARLLPPYSAARLRCAILRRAGWRIDRTSHMAGVPTWSGSGPIRDRLDIGPDCWINVRCHFELSDSVRIGSRVSIGHDVLVLTSTHRVGPSRRRAGILHTAPVTIGSGVWIGARAVILPGVTVGPGSIVATGSVVTKDVPPNTLAAGVPAEVRRQLPE